MAVYTDVDDEALAAFLDAYDLGDVTAFKGIAEGVENSNFLLATTRGRFILTLYERRVAEDDLPFFLGLLDHLAERGLPVPLPIHGRDGQALRRLCGRPAAVVSFLEGMSVRRPSVEHCAALGRGMAWLHEAGASFPGPQRANALGVPGWRPLLERAGSASDRVQPGLHDFLARELDHLSATWPAHLPAGVIHADLFPDNAFFRGTALSGIIDFYFACRDALAYDLAIAINAWCFEPDYSFNQTKSRALLAGYQSVRPLERAEREAMPTLCRGAALRFTLTRLVDWLNVPPGALVKPHDPLAFARRLRAHQHMESVAAYGLAA